jgi:hypothetical protein
VLVERAEPELRERPLLQVGDPVNIVAIDRWVPETIEMGQQHQSKQHDTQ